ncbi:hypothetical protein K7I15_17865 [Marinobacter shengliensis]|nr:hypothetical protein [Marinobacter shengliensis]
MLKTLLPRRLLGRLFKRTEHIDERSELLIFVTPKIIKNDLIQ